MRTLAFMIGLLGAMLSSSSQAEFPGDEYVLDILKARVDTFKQGTGIVVGMVDSTGVRFVSYGTTHVDRDTPVDENTIYEIGSITKVFASIVLTDMVLKGEVDLRDPVAKYLPDRVALPTLGDREITLRHLVTHRSGLPRMPDGFIYGGDNEYYTIGRMYEFLSTCTFAADIDEKFLYSNLGFGLLGQALANREGTDVETLFKRRVSGPLGLDDTRFQLNDEQTERAAGGHDWNLEPTVLLNFDALEAAGSLRSTASNLISFLKANMGLVDSPLWKTFQTSHVDRDNAIGGRMDIGMGWLLLENHGREIIWHGGATFGNMAFAGFDKEARRGVVVLANARGVYDDFGLHLLDPQVKLLRLDDPPGKPEAVDIDVEKLRPLEGEYAIGPNQILIIRIEDGRVMGNYNEGMALEMKAASETELFFEIAPFVAEFTKRKGKVTEVIWRGYGDGEVTGKKLEFYRSPPKRARLEEDLNRYAGRYEFEDKDLIFSLSVEGGELVLRADDQLPMKLIRIPDGFFA